MKKSLVMASLIMASTSSMMAMDISPFIGLDLMKGKVKSNETYNGTVTISGTSESGTYVDNGNLEDKTFGIKVGAIIENNHRIYLNYYKLTDTVYDNKVSYALPSINYDYLIINNALQGFIPYVGAHVGYGKTNFGNLFEVVDFEDKSSLDYGINLGVIKDLTKNISLELGYRYTKVDQKSSISGTFTDQVGDSISGTVSQEIEDVQTFSLGINYKF